METELTDRPVFMQAPGDKRYDVTGALRMIAKGIPTGEAVDKGGMSYRVVRSPKPKEIVKRLRADNKDLKGNVATAIARTFAQMGWHLAPVARYRLSEYFADDWICPICGLDWSSKLKPPPMQILQRINAEHLATVAGPEAGEQYHNAVNVVQCRDCLLKCRNVNIVEAALPRPDGKAQMTAVIIMGLVPVVPRKLLAPMREAWKESGGLQEAYRARTEDIFREWSEKNPGLLAAMGMSSKPKILGPDGGAVVS